MIDYTIPSTFIHEYDFPVYDIVLPQEDENYRICFNLEYFCRQRPVHKHTQII